MGDGGTLRPIDWRSLGIWDGAGVPAGVVTLAVWKATHHGYWAYLSGVLGVVPFTPTEQALEAVVVAEAATSRLGAKELARAEAVGLNESSLARLAFRAVLTETLTVGEVVSDSLAQSTGVTEARSETVTVAEVVAHLLAAIEARTETVAVTEAGTTRLGLRDALTESITASEAATDALASSDPFVLFRLQLPRPLQARKYPYYTASGWAYYTANDLLVTLLSATPRDGQFWIDTSGI